MIICCGMAVKMGIATLIDEGGYNLACFVY